MGDFRFIDLRGREVLHVHWGGNEPALPRDSKAVARCIRAFAEHGGSVEARGNLLNRHMSDPGLVATSDGPGVSDGWYSYEFFCLVFSFAKLLLKDREFRCIPECGGQPESFHTILEQGPRKSDPWKCDTRQPMAGFPPITSRRSMFISVEALLISMEYRQYLSSIFIMPTSNGEFAYTSLHHGLLHTNKLAPPIVPQPARSPMGGSMCWQTRTHNPYPMDVRTPLCPLLDSRMLGHRRTSGFDGIQKACLWVYRSFLELATQGTCRIRLLQKGVWRENFTSRIGRQSLPFRLAVPAFLIAGATGCVDATPLVLQHTEPIWSKVLTVAVIWILVPCLTVALAASGRRIRGMKQKFVATRRVIDEQYATLKETSEELLLERNALEDKVRLRTAELEASLDRLTESDRIKTNFLASITHELRTPLTMISVPVKSIRDKRYGTSIPADHPVFELVERNVDRLNRQITQLLDFARLDQGAMPFNPQLIPLVAYARGLVAEMVDLARLRGLVLVMANCTTMHEIYIHADRYMLDTALINLLNNALKFTEQGVVRLILEPEPNQVAVRVTVEDTGIGFDPAVKDSLFNRFVQGDARHDHTPEGIGLGLALVREIAVCHGWYLDADGQPGGGARFSLSMPVSPEPGCSECNSVDHVSSRIRRTAAVLPPPTMMDLPLGMTKKNVILVVDDNPDMGTLVRDVLEPDFSVAWCRRGEDAILYLSDNPLVSLIVCDVMMPGMSGFALREKLAERRDFRDIPFVFLTALNTEVDRFRGLSVGALDYVLKPFNASDLLLKIRNILDLQDARYRQALADSMAVERLSHIGLAVSTGTLDTTRIIRNASITPAEERVMELIRKGLQDKEIAERLSISPRTVASHLHRLYRKTGTGNRLELMGWMVDSGIGKS